jgi:ribosomal protein S18 acetylase RimI-like enzyme
VSAAQIALEPIDRGDPEVLALYEDFIRESDGPLGIDLEAEFSSGPPADLIAPGGLLLIARVDGAPAGLGGLRHLETDVAEIKSMYVDPRFRGRGLGRRILVELERLASAHGCVRVRLDSSDYLTAALALYRAAGYREVPDYNQNPKANVWFERQL